jgi:predicted hydrocarbon binding protein
MFELKQEYVEYLDTFKKLGIRPFRREAILRKELGDHVSILVLRDILYSILMLSPKRYIPFIYSWGKFVGTHSARQAMDVLNIAFIARMIGKIRPMKILSIDIYRDALSKSWVSVKSSIPIITYVDEGAEVFRIKTTECDEAWGLPKIGKKVCYFEGAIMAGSTEEMMKKTVNCVETKCVAHGDDFCEFLFRVNSEFPKLEIIDKKYFLKIKKSVLEQFFNKKTLRKGLGDFNHIASLQVTYLGLWLSSTGSHTLLYWVGKNTGKEIRKKLKGNVNNFSKFFKRMRIGILEKKNKGFIVKESAFSTGAKNIEKKICSYTAGLLAGFIGKNVVETKCIANGNEYCEFVTI